MQRSVKLGIATATVLLLVAAGILAVTRQNSVKHTGVSLVNESVLSGLEQRDSSGIDTSHLAPGLVPPTNKWFSGLALQKQPKTVFPMPLGFTASSTSFSYSLPEVEVAADSIASDVSQKATVQVEGANHYMVSRYDELSLDLTYYRTDGTAIGLVTVLEGSPYVQFSSMSAAKLSMSVAGTTPTAATSSAEYKTPTVSYHVVGFNGSELTASGQSISMAMPTGGLASLYALPATLNQDPLKHTAGNRIMGAEVSYSANNAGYRTAINISTINNKPTVYGMMPHHQSASESMFAYETIYGKQEMLSGQLFSFITPRAPVETSLDLSKMTNKQRELLVTTLRQDINATTYSAADSYYAGKELYRSAQLLQLANQLAEQEIATTMQTKLRQQLESWFSNFSSQGGRYFYYDSRIQSVVGVTPSFGSEEINDHHFHYGYFIYAASILAQYDKPFLQRYRSSIDLLVADIANYRNGQKLPLRRVFDHYMGHSWASGSSPFNDGNNQESSSEAINAWIGVSLWARQTTNTELAIQAGWLLSNEVQSAKSYWLAFDSSKKPYSEGYAHNLISLNWGGKRDYATFFSAEPLAKLGIQLIPMSPSMVSIFSDIPQARAGHITELGALNSYDAPFGDYALMYDSQGSPSSQSRSAGQLELAQKLRPDTIDSANSRSYLYAWIIAQQP